MSTTNHEGHFIWLNERWTIELGWSLEELCARPFIDFVHPDEVERTVEEASRLSNVSGYSVTSFVNRYRSRDGHYEWLEWKSTPGPDRLVYSTARVVTQRIEHEREQREQLDLLNAIESQASIGRWRVDMTTGVVRWSPSVFRIYGLEPAPVAPSVSAGIGGYHPDDQEMVSDAVDAAVDRGEPFAFEARVTRPTGEVRWVSVDGLVTTSDLGAPGVMHGIIRDITDERARSNKLIHTERLASVGQMAASVAHEINNPLQLVTLNIEHLEERLVGDAEALELIEDAREGAERVRRIVSALRRFARRPSEPHALTPPITLLDAALRLARPQLESHAWLELSVEEGLPDVAVDEQSFTQALLNLLTNAIQAITEAGEPGTIHARIYSEMSDSGERVVFEIEDDGCGLPLQDTARLFEPFHTTKSPEEGTGLGLSIAHDIIASHGGELTLDDRESGRGAIARATLPSARRARNAPRRRPQRPRRLAPEPALAPAPPRRGAKILLVDDEPAILFALSRGLEARGYDVTVAGDGEEALGLLRAHSDWGLVLCDLKMPTLDGMALHALTLEHAPALEPRLHFMTGDSWSSEYHEFLSSLDRPHLDKPFSLKELTRFIAANIERPHEPK